MVLKVFGYIVKQNYQSFRYEKIFAALKKCVNLDLIIENKIYTEFCQKLSLKLISFMQAAYLRYYFV